jgi:phasin family protein
MTTLYNADQIAASSKARLETLLNFANTAFAGAERLAALNFSASRSFLEDGVANARLLSGAKGINELTELHLSLAQPTAEKSLNYAHGVYEIASGTQRKLIDLVESGFAEFQRNASAAFDKASSNAPAGSDVAVAAVKSALAAANSAYESASRAARQVAEIANANVAAATGAAGFKSSNAPAPAAKARKAA